MIHFILIYTDGKLSLIYYPFEGNVAFKSSQTCHTSWWYSAPAGEKYKEKSRQYFYYEYIGIGCWDAEESLVLIIILRASDMKQMSAVMNEVNYCHTK